MCSSGDNGRAMRYPNESLLIRRLDNFLSSRRLPGLAKSPSRLRFIKELLTSQKKVHVLRMRRFQGGYDLSEKNFNPSRAITHIFENGKRDEAVWLAFLTIQFGQDVPDTLRSFYGKLGEGRWDWQSVRQNSDHIRGWMGEKWGALRRLRFGNHRKYRTMRPEHRKGPPAVIGSFVRWVKEHGAGSPYAALNSFVEDTQSEGAAFDALFHEFNVLEFRRTGRFDLLCLLGNLGILRIAPDHCYLKGATGPKDGALLMVTGRKGGRLTQEIEDTINRLRAHLGVPVEAMEDALCNWQKKRKTKRGSEEAQAGFVSIACA